MRTSVIVATADRPAALERTLRSLSASEGASPDTRLHVIIADNGDDPKTATVCKLDYPGLTVEHLSIDQRGKTVAQNRAVATSDAELLVFTDDDVEFEPGWLSELVRAARDWPGHLLFGGRVTPVWPDGSGAPPEHLERSAYLGLLFTRLDLDQEEGPVPDFRPLGPNMALRRQAFERGIRFDETIGPGSEGIPMGDEIDIAFQVQKLGQSAVYVPGSQVYHQVRKKQLSLRWQLRRGVEYGRMTAYFERDADVRKILGLPRWTIRAAPARCAEALWHFVRGRRAEAFDALMRMAFAVGSALGGRDARGREDEP